MSSNHSALFHRFKERIEGEQHHAFSRRLKRMGQCCVQLRQRHDNPEEKPNLGDNIQPAGQGRQREDGKTGRREDGKTGEANPSVSLRGGSSGPDEATLQPDRGAHRSFAI